MADGSTGLSEPLARASYRREKPALTKRQLVRRILLPLGPVVLIALALTMWLSGGRYVSTDNAYVHADKVAVSADIEGPVVEVAVKDNQRVAAGDLLFRIDDEPYRIALAAAEAQLGSVRNDIAALQATYRQRLADIRQGEADIAWY
jgi:membrane fusion protein (multidrug efflux system)